MASATTMRAGMNTVGPMSRASEGGARVTALEERTMRWPLFVHVLYWSGAVVFFALFFGRDAASPGVSLLFVALLLPVAMATTYFATEFLVPRFLLRGRYGLFALYGAYALVGSVYLELVVLVLTFILLAGYDMRWMGPPLLDVFGLVVGLYLVVFLAVAADLAVRWHRLNAARDAVERARLEAELALREAELARLKTQMQPHFLFNTLNNLYGLTLERSEHAPEVVLRISEMLDYVLYRCNAAFVPLREEIIHLRAYLDLERLRYDERVDIRLDVGDDLPDGCIAPLLLTPFVENSFKHGAARTAEPAWVHISLRAVENAVHFDVANGKPRTARGTHAAGIGLENVRRRLRLLYPETHELAIDERPDRYAIHLVVPLQPCDAAPTPEATP